VEGETLESAIGKQWYRLYENNPKLQAFAVIKNSEVVWQTDNWNLVDDVKELLKAHESSSSKISAGGLRYKKVARTEDTFVATAEKDEGHLLLARVENSIWAVAWADSSAVPELALIDLQRTAIVLRGNS
jgi:hypothetical protein